MSRMPVGLWPSWSPKMQTLIVGSPFLCWGLHHQYLPPGTCLSAHWGAEYTWCMKEIPRCLQMPKNHINVVKGCKRNLQRCKSGFGIVARTLWTSKFSLYIHAVFLCCLKECASQKLLPRPGNASLHKKQLRAIVCLPLVSPLNPWFLGALHSETYWPILDHYPYCITHLNMTQTITSKALTADHGPFLSFGRPAFGPQRRGTQRLPSLHGAAQRGSRGFGGQPCGWRGGWDAILKGTLMGNIWKHGDKLINIVELWAA